MITPVYILNIELQKLNLVYFELLRYQNVLKDIL